MAEQAAAGAQGTTETPAEQQTTEQAAAQATTEQKTGGEAAGTEAAAGTAATTTATEGGKTAGDGKTSDEGAGAQKEGAADDKAGAASKVPDKYALTVPDGAIVDAEDLAFVERVAKEAGWSNAEAQAALEEHLAVVADQAARWRAQTEADASYGGEHLAESKRLADVVINQVRPVGHPRRESFIRFLNKAGAGNHIEVVSFMADLGRILAEDGAEAAGTGGGGGGGERDAASVLYGGTN